MQLHDDARKMIVFLGVRTKNKKGESVPEFGGTAFFVAHDGFPYLITARHNANALGGPFVIGANDTKGRLGLIDIDAADWIFHPDKNVDVAMLQIGLADSDWSPFSTEAIAVRGPTEHRNFGTGDLVYIVGLYRLFPGKERVLPIVHTGHIAMTPDEEIPIKNRTTGDLIKTRGYLVEAQTLEGLSGSPVLVRYTNPTGMATGRGRLIGYTANVYLLGMWLGAWDLPAGETLKQMLGRDARVPVGIGVTVPVERIMEVLDSDPVKEARKKMLDERDAANAASLDSAIPSKSAPSTKADIPPTDAERFNSLVDAAARKKPRAG